MPSQRPIATAPPAPLNLADPPEALTAPVARIDAYLGEYIASMDLPRNLSDAVLYSLLGPGKRMRPLLTWHCFTAVTQTESGHAAASADPAACLPACASIEMVHAFSLIHDDLPGIDNDDLRRGRPTLHRHTNEATAILAGDCLLAGAFQVLTDRVGSLTLQAELTREVSVGAGRMIAGQMLDTLGGLSPGLSPQQRLQLIHRNKTGMLIRAACRMGALCGLEDRPGAGRFDALGAVTHFADSIGLMFQIVDDLLDVTQSTAHLGKKSGKDQEAGKLTYPGVLGVDESHEQVRRLHESALTALEPLSEAAEPLRQLATYLAVRTR